VIYCEDFESGDASGWELMEDWAVVSEDDNYFLQGENHGFAILRHEGWEDYRL
jgi:hypothetical protein